MTPSEIKTLCIKASQTYYNYLEANNKGRSEIDVYSIETLNPEEGIFKLRISKKIFELDAIFFKPATSQGEYDSNRIKIVEYDIDTNTLIIKPQNELKALFRGLKPEQLKIISDLKFLVERVKTWYEINGDKVRLPGEPSVLKETFPQINFLEQMAPSQNQKDALQNIFANPFSYVWGAPGTGKTQFVLAYSIIHYIKQGKKVAIFAPTNNAIEQVLEGVLKMTGLAGIDNRQILRLGNPSKKFAERFPEVCEVKGVMKKIAEIDNQIKIITKIIEREELKTSIERIENAFFIFDKLDEFVESRKGTQRRFKTAEAEWSVLLNRFDLKQSEINIIKREMSVLEGKINSVFHSAKKFFSQSPTREENELSELRQRMEEMVKENGDIHLEMQRSQSVAQALKKESEDLSRADILIKQLQALCSSRERAKTIVAGMTLDNYKNVKVELQRFINGTRVELNISDSLADGYPGLNSQELKEKLGELEHEKLFLQSRTTEERIKRVNVTASTLDYYIGNFVDEELKADHLFLDEASYANIVKALTLFRQNVPITLLGDHWQLPPVCEIGDDQLNTRPEYCDVFIWSQSSIHIESLFRKTKEKIYADYTFNAVAEFNYLRKSDLKETHRFGENLAKVLDAYVYQNEFQSANREGETTIYYLNAPNRQSSPNRRENYAEAAAIQQIVKNNKLKDFVILTPYKNQMAKIGILLPNERNNHLILTVHGSQGREWDTVILSVSDTSDKWFTDSQNRASKGKNLINTAVSRAKKRLIIVCDYYYWIKQNKQLITGLLKAGEPFGDPEKR